jgi:hypothetical protein
MTPTDHSVILSANRLKSPDGSTQRDQAAPGTSIHSYRFEAVMHDNSPQEEKLLAAGRKTGSLSILRIENLQL